MTEMAQLMEYGDPSERYFVGRRVHHFSRWARCCQLVLRSQSLVILLFGAGVIALVRFLSTNLLTVACVGDSITRGDGAPASESYPSQLQRLLGPTYRVLNFGVDGTTVTKRGDSPYWKTSQFQSATRSLAQVFIIMLGTNDAKPWNWDPTSYEADYNSMIARFSSHQIHGARPQVLLMVPPPGFDQGRYGINTTITNVVLAPVIRRIASSHNMLPPIDAHKSFAERCSDFGKTCHLMSGENHDNNIHPNAEGYRVIAETVHKYLLHHVYPS